ncbi:MAG: M28 family peptidase [Balneolaceae bacterium]|nr:M28 family peptidase [Balneolaceae bacterium]
MLKKLLFVGIAVSIGACSVFKGTESSKSNIHDFSDEITAEGLYNDLAAFSHDTLRGRETGTEDLDRAADFLVRKYSALGLEPVGDNNTYFQHFDLAQPTVSSYSYRIYKNDELIEESVLSKEEETTYIATIFGGSDPLKGEVIFAGYGMYNEEAGVNHYPENAEGKWLMVFFKRGTTNMGYLQSMFQNSGALGALLIMSPENPAEFDQQAAGVRQNLGNSGRLSLAYLQNDNAGAAPAYNRIHPMLAASLLDLDSTEALVELSNTLAEEPEGFEAQQLEYVVEHEANVEENTVTSKNIAAFLEGSDPELKDEVVVLSAHYDHVGVGRPDSTGDAIYNGADDDGSGTIATLHAAKAMAAAKKAGVGPRRSVLFLSVAGEEKGLLGSRYYSDHPIFPIENTVTNINIDMIGRVDKEHVNDSSYVYIIGGEIISSGLDSLTQLANAKGDNIKLSKRYNDLEDPNQFYRRSDHWNFGRLGVPFVFFFNGTHPDYHRPGDEIDKITLKPYLQRTRLVYNLTAVVANSDERPEVDNQEFIQKTQVQAR